MRTCSWLLSWIFVFFVGCPHLFSAAPVVHIYLAEKWMTLHCPNYSEVDRKAFLVGTLFPDIRYLGVISRSDTHELGVKLEDILNAKTPFFSGKKLHCYIDEQRENLVKEWKIYHKLPEMTHEQRATFLKLVEDEILFSKSDWKEARDALNKIEAEEMTYEIKGDDVQLWHAILIQYLSMRPSLVLFELGQFHQKYMNIPPDKTAEWSNEVINTSKKEDIQQYVLNLLAHFEKAFDMKGIEKKSVTH